MGSILVLLPLLLPYLGSSSTAATPTFLLEGSNVSYAQFPKWDPCHNGSIRLEFSTLRPSGLLLYTDDGGYYDFFELKLVDGVGWLRCNLGGENVLLFNEGQELNDGEWHEVEIRRSETETTFSVDNIEQTKTTSSDDLTFGKFDDNNHVYVGGMPKDFEEDLRALALPSVVFEPHFGGKIRGLQFSNCGEELRSVKMRDSRGVRKTQIDHCAQRDPCLNDGVCISTDLGTQCDCTHTGFKGHLCQTERTPVEMTLFGQEFVTYDLSGHADSIVGKNDEIRLQFRSRQSTGLLFYTGHGADYLIVTLKEGVVNVDINLGSGEFSAEVKPPQEDVRFDDNSWHTLLVSRRSREVVVVVDGLYQETGTTVGKFTMLSSEQLYLGGATNVSSLPGTTHYVSNFRGCMQQVLYTADTVKLPLLDMAEQNHSLLTVHGRPSLDGCHDDPSSQPITFLTEDSVLHLPNWRFASDSSIRVTIRTNEPNGLIMYCVIEDRSKFFSLELLEGFLYFVLNLGSGTLRVKGSERVLTDSIPHVILITAQTRKGQIVVDGREEQKFRIEHGSKKWEIEGILHIGGMSDLEASPRLPQQIWAGMLRHGYVGCMQDLEWSGNKVDIAGLARDQRAIGIALYCRATESRCRKHPCRHRGVCQDGWNRIKCDCSSTGYDGRTCNEAATTLKFDGSQYVRVTLLEESSTEVEDISLRFRTRRPDGLLLTTTAWNSNDQLKLKLLDGQVQLYVQSGDDSKSLLAGSSLNDHNWHTVHVKRRAEALELSVDKESPVKGTVPGSDPTLHANEVHIGARSSSSQHDKVGGKVDALELKTIQAGRDTSADSAERDTDRDDVNFVGDMQQFVFNGNRFFELARTRKIKNIEATATFKKKAKAVNFPLTFKSPEAFLNTRLKLYSTFSIYFLVRTTQPDGLLMYSGSGKGKDFMAIELVDGHLRYIFNVGSGPRVMEVLDQPINDNRWHDISIIRPSLTQHLVRVDDAVATDNLPDSRSVHFDTGNAFYVGGVKKHMYDDLPIQVMSREGFQGCLASLDLDGESGNFLKHHRSEVPDHFSDDVISGCEGPSIECERDSCANNGTCIQHWTSYTCDCDMTSFTGPACEEYGAAYEFGEAGGTITYMYGTNERKDVHEDSVALGFITTQKEAVLLRIESGDSVDYIEMELVKGNLFVVYSMGSMDLPVGETFTRVNDGQYHVVRFKRNGQNSTLQVDDLDVQPKHPSAEDYKLIYPDVVWTGDQLTVFNDQAKIIVGRRPPESGPPSEPFQGIIAGLVVNKKSVLDAAVRGDPKVTISGDVELAIDSLPKRPVTPATPNAATPGTQSTMGVATVHGMDEDGDELIHSGRGCHDDEEVDCSHLETTPTEDDLIVPVLTVRTTPAPPTTTSATWPDSGETGSGTDCDDEEDCENGSGIDPVDPVFTPKTTTDDLIILNSTEQTKGGGDKSDGEETVPPDAEGTTSTLFITVNFTEAPSKKPPFPFSTSKAGNGSSSGEGDKGAGGKKERDRNGSYGKGKDPYEKRKKSPMSVNIGLIVGIAAGVVLLLLILGYAFYKYKSRDEGSYKIDESKNYSYEAYTAQAAKQPSTPHINGGMAKTSTYSSSSKPKKKDVKEWYV